MSKFITAYWRIIKMKLALFLGTLLFSLNVFAASVTDLNTALHKTIRSKTTKTATQMVYAGRDILKPPVINEITNTPTETSYS
jgi:hypothetical protein